MLHNQCNRWYGRRHVWENRDAGINSEVSCDNGNDETSLKHNSDNAPRSGRPVEADKDAIKALVDVNRRITTREIGLRLNLSNSTVYDHLKGLGLSSKLDVWVPLVLTERNLCRRIDVCDSLLKRHENYPFLKRIITGDEKGHGAKKMCEPVQTISKIDIHQKKDTLTSERKEPKKIEKPKKVNINDENMQNFDYQQPSEKDIVQPEDISNVPTENCLENVEFEFEKYVDVGSWSKFLEILETNGLLLDNCRGQSFDNAANMSGRYNDVQAILKEKNKFANYVPYIAYSLNLVGVGVKVVTEIVNLVQ
ncbi:histone-lysine N-methyltransferase SETMAR [Trichonephila clavipes]|nr:histone-lysine N-methyltransferase SETMAR [Trichonephila clavipes]